MLFLCRTSGSSSAKLCLRSTTCRPSSSSRTPCWRPLPTDAPPAWWWTREPPTPPPCQSTMATCSRTPLSIHFLTTQCQQFLQVPRNVFSQIWSFCFFFEIFFGSLLKKIVSYKLSTKYLHTYSCKFEKT